MLLRFWTISIAPEREKEYIAFAQERSTPMFLSQRGCLGVLFLKSGDGMHAACSFWRNSTDINALAASSTYNATVSDLEATGLLVGAANIVLFDLET